MQRRPPVRVRLAVVPLTLWPELPVPMENPGWLSPVLVILALGSSVTVGQRFLYAYREMNRLDREERAAACEEAKDTP